MVVLEAWAYGKPVLMTPECNLPEGFANHAAVRIDPNTDSIVQGLASFFSMSDADHIAMGEKGFLLVESRFSWKFVARQLKETYEWMLGGGSTPSCLYSR